MSLRYEQYHALMYARDFMRDLLRAGGRWTKADLRTRAHRALRHFPPLGYDGSPLFSQDDYSPPMPSCGCVKKCLRKRSKAK